MPTFEINPPSGGDPFVYEDWVFVEVKVNSRSAILSAEQWDFLEVQSLKLLKVHDILVTHLVPALGVATKDWGTRPICITRMPDSKLPG